MAALPFGLFQGQQNTGATSKGSDGAAHMAHMHMVHTPAGRVPIMAPPSAFNPLMFHEGGPQMVMQGAGPWMHDASGMAGMPGSGSSAMEQWPGMYPSGMYSSMFPCLPQYPGLQHFGQHMSHEQMAMMQPYASMSSAARLHHPHLSLDDAPEGKQGKDKKKRRGGGADVSEVLLLSCPPLPHMLLLCSGKERERERGEPGGEWRASLPATPA